MMQLLLSFFLFLFTSSLLAFEELSIPQYQETEHNPPSLVNIASTPSAIVNGSVNVITGDYVESDIVYKVSGPDPYVLGHSYASSSLEEGTLGSGWNFAHYHFLQVKQPLGINFSRGGEEDWINTSAALLAGELLPRGNHVVKNVEGIKVHKEVRHEEANPYTLLFLTEPSGGRLIFKGNGWARDFKAITENTGFTNVTSSLSGQTNIKNIYARWHAESDRFHVTFGDGTRRIYARQWKTDRFKHIHGHHAKYYRDYHLVHEIKPSGNHVHYTYNDRFEIVKIITYNRDYSKTLNWIRFFQKPSNEFKSEPSLHIHTSDKQHFIYNFQKLKSTGYSKFVDSLDHFGRKKETLKYAFPGKNREEIIQKAKENRDPGTYGVLGVKRPKMPYTRFIYSKTPIGDKRRVVKKETEDGNFIETKYYNTDDSWLQNRVRLQKGPVGPGNTRKTTHTFYYHRDGKEAGHANVFDAYGARTRYFWDENRRLTKVIRYDDKKELVMKECFLWGKDKLDGALIAHTVFDEENKPKFSRTFTYDKKGNVIEEKLFGRFTQNKGSIRFEKGLPKAEGIDVLTTRYSYSDDAFNVKTAECDPEGNYTYYEYLKETNLLTAKFVCDKTNVVHREFYAYDVNGIVVETIVDDGSTKDKKDLKGVTSRHYTLVTPRTVSPHFGEPEIVSEYYHDFETKKKVLLKRRVNHFSDLGFVIKQELFDAKGVLSAVTEYERDKIGRVTLVRDPANRVERFSYYRSGRLKKKEMPKATLSFSYDAIGRLVKQKEVQKEGLALTLSYEYDLLGRKSKEINPFGEVTSFEYDQLNRPTKISSPKIFDLKGRKCTPTKKIEYKKLGTKRLETDENGYVSIYTYSAIGKLFEEVLSDGTKRRFCYDKRANLVQQTEPHGAMIQLSYDGLNRATKKVISYKGKTLSKERMHYNGFHLVEEEGPSGERLRYSYDAAGRKIGTEQKGTKSTYSYDDMGRLSEEKSFYTDRHFVCKKYAYDQSNRVIGETASDDKDKIHTYTIFSYDVDGNRSECTTPVLNQLATEKTRFLAHGMPSEYQDAQGNIWHYFYDFHFENKHGQKVCKRITVNPQGVSQHEIFDARGSISELLTIGLFGELLTDKELFYDARGNLVTVHEHVIEAGKSVDVIKTRLYYGPNNRLEKVVEAYGTIDAKTTGYRYNEFGQKLCTERADGIGLFTVYDEKGRVSEFFAQDNSVDYKYSYDASDRILSVRNNVTQKKTVREYNDSGDLVCETLESGLTISYAYDGLKRPTEITLPDASSIAYRYSAAYLQSVARHNQKGNKLWEHAIGERDSSGKPLVVELAKNAGVLKYDYDVSGRAVSLSHPEFHERILEFDAVGNVLRLSSQGAITTYNYDSLSQLVEERGKKLHSYAYNSLYDRRQKDDAFYTVNRLHATLSDEKNHYSYDENGNRIQDSKNHYKYDALDRLIEVKTGDKEKIVYTYDAFDRRMQKTVYDKAHNKKETVRYIYVGQDEIGAVDAHDTITELRILAEGKGAEIGSACAFELREELYIPLHDLRGNVAALIDPESGKAVERYQYDAFGNEEIYDRKGQIVSESLCKNPWRFSSKRVDNETMLLFFGRRYYDPTLGSWLTMDPLGLKAGPNLYAYVCNNPITHFDLYGLIDETEAGAADRTWTDRVRDFVSDGCRRIRDLLCKVGEEVVHNLPHIGDWNDRIEDSLRSIRGAGTKNRTIGLELVAKASPNANPNECGLFINGMNCSAKAAWANAEALRDAFGTVHPDIYAITVPEKGFCMEVIRALLNVINIPTPDISIVRNGLETLTKSYSTIITTPHSLGGTRFQLATKDFSRDDKGKFRVLGIGSAGYFSKNDGFIDPKNCCDRTDFVPFVGDFFGVVVSFLRGENNMQFVGSPFGVPGSGHAYRSQEYMKWIRDELKDR